MGFGGDVDDFLDEDGVEVRGRQPSLGRVVERIGLGPAQVKVVLAAGSVWFADGAELLLISSVTDSVSDVWGLSSFESGFIVSLVYIGVLLGNMMSGPIGDLHGRRLPIVVSFWLIFAFSLASAASTAFWMLCSLRLLVGIGMGVGQPSYQALISETTPSYGRVIIFGLGSSLFALGEIYSAVLIYIDDPQMEDLHWRWLLSMGALPAAFFGIMTFLVLPQSPYYLSCNDRFQEARDVLTGLASDNFQPDMDVGFDTSRAHRQNSGGPDEAFHWKFLFSQEMMSTTLIMVYTCFVLNFTFYGCLYAFPNVMGDVDLGSSPAMDLVLGAMVELVGLAVALAVMNYLPRKTVMKIYLFMISVCLVVFAAAVSGSGWEIMAMRYFGYYGIKFFVAMGYIVAFLYATEVYPASCRATGVSVCLAGGRLGAIVSPIVFEVAEDMSGGFTCFFFALAILSAVNFCLISFLVHETQGLLLRETSGQAHESASEEKSK